MLKYDFSGKTVIVTGSSRGIGKATALAFGRAGASVVVAHASAGSKPIAEEVAQEITASGGKSAVVCGLIQEVETCKRLVDAAVALSSTGKVDILIHNAGHGDDCALATLTPEFYQLQMDSNVKGPIMLTQQALPHLARDSRIVLLSSVSARMGLPHSTVYAGTKGALESIARVWAKELGAQYRCTVNCVNPGPVNTDMWPDSCEPDTLAYINPIIDATPAEGRLGEVSDIVPLILFLSSEGARWVTGSTLCANGGMVYV